jgi:hypothetical protein
MAACRDTSPAWEGCGCNAILLCDVTSWRRASSRWPGKPLQARHGGDAVQDRQETGRRPQNARRTRVPPGWRAAGGPGAQCNASVWRRSGRRNRCAPVRRQRLRQPRHACERSPRQQTAYPSDACAVNIRTSQLNSPRRAICHGAFASQFGAAAQPGAAACAAWALAGRPASAPARIDQPTVLPTDVS